MAIDPAKWSTLGLSIVSSPWRMGYDRKLCADVLDAFITSLCRSLRRRAKSQLGLRSVEDALFGELFSSGGTTRATRCSAPSGSALAGYTVNRSASGRRST
jgi:hypothetical protein